MFPTVAGTVAILLAAGSSRRMGLPKPFLQINEMPLVQQMANILIAGGVEFVMVVTSPELLRCFDGIPLRVIVNPEPEAGMLSSVQIGLTQAKQTEFSSLLVCPCDLPLLTPETVYAILHCWKTQCYSDPTVVVVPTFEGKRGHPTLFASGLCGEILALDSKQVGLNELLKRRKAQVWEVPVNDSGGVCDADTPDTWERLIGTPPVCWRKTE